MWLELPIQCYVAVARGIFALFFGFRRQYLVFHHWIWYYLNLSWMSWTHWSPFLFLVFWVALLWMGVEFCQVLFLGLCTFLFLLIWFLYCVISSCWITFSFLWYIRLGYDVLILWICDWIWFANILENFCLSIYKGYWYMIFFLYDVFVWFWY